MAKELRFSLAGAEYASAPVKLDRKKLYGWSDLVATDKAGEVCGTAYLSPDDALLIPSGGYKQCTVDNDGRWVEKSELTPYTEDGSEIPVYASSFDLVIELSAKATEEKFQTTGRYPAYIFYHTDYSSARKELIKRDMAFSSDEQQIRNILATELADNIKKGWEEVL